ncbi:MAG: hypothetical protein ACOZCL_02755 [Bacillota bacterium]
MKNKNKKHTATAYNPKLKDVNTVREKQEIIDPEKGPSGRR